MRSGLTFSTEPLRRSNHVEHDFDGRFESDHSRLRQWIVSDSERSAAPTDDSRLHR